LPKLEISALFFARSTTNSPPPEGRSPSLGPIFHPRAGCRNSASRKKFWNQLHIMAVTSFIPHFGVSAHRHTPRSASQPAKVLAILRRFVQNE